jgi:hypothetical protein
MFNNGHAKGNAKGDTNGDTSGAHHTVLLAKSYSPTTTRPITETHYNKRDTIITYLARRPEAADESILGPSRDKTSSDLPAAVEPSGLSTLRTWNLFLAF